MPKHHHFVFDSEGHCIGESFLNGRVDHSSLRPTKKLCDMSMADHDEIKERFGKKRAGKGWRTNREAKFEQIHTDLYGS